MPTPSFSAFRFWLLILAGFAVFLWLFNPVLFPFLAGLAIAYFLEPVVEALEKRRVHRWLGALIVLSAFLFVVAAIFILLWPMVNSQIAALIDALPEYMTKIREQYLPGILDWLSRFSPEDVAKIRDAATQSTGEAFGFVSNTVKSLVSGGFALIDAVVLSVLAPVTAFYVLRDWKKLTAVIDQLIPRPHYAVIREQLTEIDDTLSGFMRGQAIVCVILGVFYSVGLAISGLEFGGTVGLIAGVLSLIPYVGTIFGWIMSVVLATVQFDGNWMCLIIVMTVFIIGNFFETYILLPRLVGSRIRLHPVWILFALIAGIKLMGFTGVLIAVPTAAVLGVLVRFGIRQYRTSKLYK
ncbi:MAG: AI-2E family transporter [Bdellovibrionales bacterium]